MKYLVLASLIFITGCNSLKYKAEFCMKEAATENYKCETLATFKNSETCEHFSLTYQSRIDWDELAKGKPTTATFTPNTSLATVSCKNN